MRLRLSFRYLGLHFYDRVGFVLPIDAIDPKAQTDSLALNWVRSAESRLASIDPIHHK